MTMQNVLITPKKGIVLTGNEGPMIADDLVQEFRQARERVEKRWGVSITLEAV